MLRGNKKAKVPHPEHFPTVETLLKVTNSGESSV